MLSNLSGCLKKKVHFASLSPIIFVQTLQDRFFPSPNYNRRNATRKVSMCMHRRDSRTIRLDTVIASSASRLTPGTRHARESSGVLVITGAGASSPWMIRAKPASCQREVPPGRRRSRFDTRLIELYSQQFKRS